MTEPGSSDMGPSRQEGINHAISQMVEVSKGDGTFRTRQPIVGIRDE
ncbi:hypothetical protein RBWH47_01812 [Rhodopirellula baltica WH47]|uniref:Uncharacterized protein n=1 Tax=Rhodopirellula baltica WH47 TaxID=991778 RepID=F2AT78_RHOBT|nr:hypothetical protein RBWH47_01812 [Rhodopirellula baltica WH47]